MDSKQGTAAVKRTSAGLRDALFDEIDALRGGRSTPQRASAVAKLAVQIIGTVHMDIEYQKHVVSTPAALSTKLPPIELGKAA
jgi:hypothetical protein